MENRMGEGLRAAAVMCLVWAGAAGALRAQKVELRPAAPPADAKPLAYIVTGRTLASETSFLKVFGAQEYKSQWPGTYYEASFRGSEVFLRFGENHAIFHVVVDGQAPLILRKPEPAIYRLSGLQEARHTVRVQVATEDQTLPTVFGGFALRGDEEGEPVVKQQRQIEFIGDSHTVGYGNTSLKRECTPDEVWATTDTSAAFGALTADHYRAAYEVNAISGRGIVRNYNGSAGDTLPTAYPYVLFDHKQRYDDHAWRPQVILIALGTNDFSTALNAGEKWKTREALHADYEATYLRFVKEIRAGNPKALLLLWATDVAQGEIEAEEAKVVQQARAQGDSRVRFVPVEHLQFSGCHSHPSLADDRTIEEKLVREIDAVPGVWQGK